MERFQYATYARDWFVFDGSLILTANDDYVSIDGIHSAFREGRIPDPRQSPHIGLPCIDARSLRNLLIRKAFPLNLVLSGKGIGSVAHNRGYDVAASGAYVRDITSVKLLLDMDAKEVRLSVSIEASPTKQQTPPIELSASDKEPFSFSHVFHVSNEDVPELLNMDEDQRWRFRRTVSEITGPAHVVSA